MRLSLTVDIPDSLIQKLEGFAQNQQRTIADIIRDVVLQNWQLLPQLPDDAEAELAALPNLSDEALWLLARSTFTQEEQQDLATLNQEAKERTLMTDEEKRLEKLLDLYDRMMVRRAQAASLLQQRGYNLDDPSVIQPK